MRHGKKFNHLTRKTAHRAATLKSMAVALFTHKKITTTVAKAKALKVYAEPLITKAKDNTTHSRRVVFSYLQDKEVVTELFSTIAAKVGDRPGGYTRIIRSGFRQGDNAEMCFIELVDFNEFLATEEKKSRRRSKKKKADSPVGVTPAVEITPVVADEVATGEETSSEESTEDKKEDA